MSIQTTPRPSPARDLSALLHSRRLTEVRAARACWHDALTAAAARYDFSQPSHLDRFRLRVYLMAPHAPLEQLRDLTAAYGAEPSLSSDRWDVLDALIAAYLAHGRS